MTGTQSHKSLMRENFKQREQIETISKVFKQFHDQHVCLQAPRSMLQQHHYYEYWLLFIAGAVYGYYFIFTSNWRKSFIFSTNL